MSDKITIAQALRRVKKIKGQIAENQQRALLGVSYESTKVPAFRYQEAVTSMFALQDEMVSLEARVAVANATSTVQHQSQTVTLALAIRTLQELKGRIAFLKGLSLRHEVVKNRETEWDEDQMKNVTRVTEVTFISDLSERDRDTQVKELQNTFETLNNAVEDANHGLLV